GRSSGLRLDLEYKIAGACKRSDHFHPRGIESVHEFISPVGGDDTHAENECTKSLAITALYLRGRGTRHMSGQRRVPRRRTDRLKLRNHEFIHPGRVVERGNAPFVARISKYTIRIIDHCAHAIP